MKRTFIFISSLILAITSLSFRPFGTEVRHITSAFDRKTGALIYIEDRQMLENNGRPDSWKFKYRDPSGKIIVEREVKFTSDLLKPDFKLLDLRNGYSEGAENVGGRIKVFTGGSADDPYAEKFLTVPEPAVVDAGFDIFVQQNWERLADGQITSFNFVAPSQLDYFSFRIRKDADIIIQGRPASVIKLEIDNFFLRLFVEAIKVTYDQETRKLVRYEGISNIYDDKGKSHKIVMNFAPK